MSKNFILTDISSQTPFIVYFLSKDIHLHSVYRPCPPFLLYIYYLILSIYEINAKKYSLPCKAPSHLSLSLILSPSRNLRPHSQAHTRSHPAPALTARFGTDSGSCPLTVTRGATPLRALYVLLLLLLCHYNESEQLNMIKNLNKCLDKILCVCC